MIRAAAASDAPAICEIWNAVIRHSTITFTTLERTITDVETIVARQSVFVAELQDDVIGFATFGPFRSGPGYRYTAEYTIYLNESAHGQGVGAQLLAAVETAASDAGIDVLIAGIDGGNAQAQKFHHKHGFQQVGLLLGVGEKFGARHDLVLMQKKLTTRH